MSYKEDNSGVEFPLAIVGITLTFLVVIPEEVYKELFEDIDALVEAAVKKQFFHYTISEDALSFFKTMPKCGYTLGFSAENNLCQLKIEVKEDTNKVLLDLLEICAKWDLMLILSRFDGRGGEAFSVGESCSGEGGEEDEDDGTARKPETEESKVKSQGELGGIDYHH